MDGYRLLLEMFFTLAGSHAPAEAFTEMYGAPQSCVSTVFGTKGDKLAGGKAVYLGRPVHPDVDVGIAHRTLPMGSLVVLQNPLKPERWLIAQVIDRGPYGAILEDEEPDPEQTCRTRSDGRTWCVKRNNEEPGEWRGCIDATPLAAKLLEHSGFQRLRYWPIPGTKPKSIWYWPAFEVKQKERRERIEARKRSS